MIKLHTHYTEKRGSQFPPEIHAKKYSRKNDMSGKDKSMTYFFT